MQALLDLLRMLLLGLLRFLPQLLVLKSLALNQT
jgi:hypothetical protein